MAPAISGGEGFPLQKVRFRWHEDRADLAAREPPVARTGSPVWRGGTPCRWWVGFEMTLFETKRRRGTFLVIIAVLLLVATLSTNHWASTQAVHRAKSAESCSERI